MTGSSVGMNQLYVKEKYLQNRGRDNKIVLGTNRRISRYSSVTCGNVMLVLQSTSLGAYLTLLGPFRCLLKWDS